MSRILILIRIFRFAILLIIAFFAVACQPSSGALPPSPKAPQDSIPPTLSVPETSTSPFSGCDGSATPEVVPPQLKEVDPNPAAPGEEITLKGSGGYTRCGSTYIESAREFQLYFDDQPVTQITCYVNHCETKLTVPGDAAAGEHVIKVKGGSQIKLTVSQ